MQTSKSAGGVVINSKKEICLVLQRGKGWVIPKGHIEKNEITEEAAVREIKEETGLKIIRLIKKLGIVERKNLYNENEIKRIHFFIFKTDDAILKPDENDDSVTGARWFSLDEAIKTNSSKEEKEFLEKNREIILNC